MHGLLPAVRVRRTRNVNFWSLVVEDMRKWCQVEVSIKGETDASSTNLDLAGILHADASVHFVGPITSHDATPSSTFNHDALEDANMLGLATSMSCGCSASFHGTKKSATIRCHLLVQK